MARNKNRDREIAPTKSRNRRFAIARLLPQESASRICKSYGGLLTAMEFVIARSLRVLTRAVADRPIEVNRGQRAVLQDHGSSQTAPEWHGGPAESTASTLPCESGREWDYPRPEWAPRAHT